jgi:hypothetical protein
VEHLRAVADDPRLLDLRADHEARHVHQEHERDPERVAEVHEARGLVGRVVVEDPAEVLGWLATMPGGRPPKRAKPVTSVLAHCGLSSNSSPSSTIREITSWMS